MKLWFSRDRVPEGETAVGRYLVWQFRHSLDCMTEKRAHTNAVTFPEEPSGCTLVYWGPGHYSSWRYEAPDTYSGKAWRDRSDRVYRNHIKHLKRLLARFQKQRVPAACRTFAEYKKKSLTLEIALLAGQETIPLSEALDLQRERIEAGRMAQAELERLREQYRDSYSAELQKRDLEWDEYQLPGKKWRF